MVKPVGQYLAQLEVDVLNIHAPYIFTHFEYL